MHTHACIHMHAYTCVHTRVHTQVCIHMSTCTCIHIYIYIYIYIYIHIYIHRVSQKWCPTHVLGLSVCCLFDICFAVWKKVEINERHIFNLFILNYSISSGNKEL